MVKTIEEMEGLIYLEDGTVFKGIRLRRTGELLWESWFSTHP